MSNFPRIAIVGLGYWGPNLIRNFEAIGQLAAFCDKDPEAIAKARKSAPNATTYDDYNQVLLDPTIDAVAIATPAIMHGDMVRQALNADKHVFVEKPICLTLDEGCKLRSLALERKRILMVGHLLHYHPAFQALTDHIEAGNIGTLRYIYSNRLSLGKVRTEENALWSFAPHDIAMILALAGRMPERVSCQGGAWLSPDVADTTISHFTFSNQLQGHIFVSWLHPYKEHRLVIVGSEGMIVFNDSAQGEEKLWIYPHAVRYQNDLPVIDKAIGQRLPFEPTEPLFNECNHFIHCIRSGTTPKSNADEGLRVLSVLDACQRSLTGGQAVTPEAVE